MDTGGRGPSPDRGTPTQRLPRSSRIQRSTEIRWLLRRGKRKRTANLDVFFSTSPFFRPRLGLIVPKHRHRIVERNRLKRRLREIARTEVLPFLREAGRNLDVLVRARREAYSVGYATLRAEVRGVAEALCSEKFYSE
ncbi:MAG: ribonuclease P protein component [Longimicrobiales bacterium]